MNASFLVISLFLGFLGYRVILPPDVFIKSSVINTPINRYYAPGGFSKATAPTAVVTPAMQ
jgi:hypothetical protein